MKYLLYLPEDYGSSKQQWPLMLFLHGAGERGVGTDIGPNEMLTFDIELVDIK